MNTNHISVITLNVNGPNSSNKRYSLADLIKKTKSNNKLSPRDSLHRQRHPQTEGERIEKNISLIQIVETIRGFHPHIRKGGLLAKVNQKGQRRSFHSTEGNYTSARHKIINICAPNNGASMYIKPFTISRIK